MNITIIYAYPHDGGYNRALLESVLSGFSANSHDHDITVLDLYKKTLIPFCALMTLIDVVI